MTPRVLRTAETIALTNITADGYIANSTTLLSLPNEADIELLYTRVGSSWTEGRCTLQDIKPHPDGAELLVKQPCWDNQVRISEASPLLELFIDIRIASFDTQISN